jgi:Ca-activated chloride channel family protein
VRFSHPFWLFGSGLALVVGVILVAGAFLLVRAARRFGDEARVRALMTADPASRRTVKGVLLVLAVAVGFVALAQPQYGRGTRLVPATNLDVVIVLDYSKSMYARDVTPSRIERAKTEVGRLIADLPGARFGAVAFAGEPVSFPLTSDGGAIAQFFRQLSPTDMPVGGTAIGRALESGLDLLRRDPLSTRHRRVIVLVTDGEDLEGDPVTVAESAAKEHVTIHVVQIGGRTPEAIPDIDENGKVVGWRKDSEGQPLTTSLSSAGEEQLTKIAQAAGGNVVRSERGATGITVIAEAMKRMMTEELSERVETVYADVYAYPAGLALLLLLVEANVAEVRKKRRQGKKGRNVEAAVVSVILALVFGVGCQDGLFRRNAPAVDEALKALDAGDPAQAATDLQHYLSTGECKAGELGTPDSVRTLPNASFDLGLALFRIAERFGGRLGDDAKPQTPAPTPAGNGVGEDVDCALRVVRIVANDDSVPLPLRAKAEYLTGNLEFLRHKYEDAVTAYDAALKLFPAEKDAKDDSPAARAAWNRAIALTRIEEEKNKKPDAGPPKEQPDGGNPEPDAGKKPEPQPDAGNKKNDDKKNDDKKDKKDPKDKKDDKGNQPKPEEKAPQKRPQPSLSQDERMLDNLEQAPTVQQEAAKRNAAHARVNSGMEDK